MQALLATDPNTDPRFWLTFEQAAVGMALVLPTGRFLRANPEFCKFVGYSEDELKELSLQNVTHPDDVEAELLYMNTMLTNTTSTYRMEKRFVRRNRLVAWGQVSASLVREGAAGPMHVILVVQDITARKVAQQELEQARNRYHAIADGVDGLVSIQDLNGIYLFASAWSSKLLGFTPTEIVGSNAYGYLHPNDVQEVMNRYQKYHVGSDEPTLMRCRMRRKDGEYIWVETYARPVPGPASSGEDRELVCISREAQQAAHGKAEVAKGVEDQSQAAEVSGQHDDVTGLLGRKATEEWLRGRLVSRRASSYPIGCLLVDVDNFKTITDRYGEAIGNIVLRKIARILYSSCRTEDLVGRWERDRFLVVLPATGPPGTIVVGEKLVGNVRNADWSGTPVSEKVTVSLGGTCVMHSSIITLEGLMSIIEAQLARAKEAGRDRMVMNARETIKLTPEQLPPKPIDPTRRE